MITSRQHRQMMAMERDFAVRKYAMVRGAKNSIWLLLAAIVAILFNLKTQGVW